MKLSLDNSLVGKRFRSIKGELCHVVNEFIDENDTMITYKKWVKRGQYWDYYTDPKEIFLIRFEYGAKWIDK